MSAITPQQINKELSGYSFEDVETEVVRRILQKSGLNSVQNHQILKILERKVSSGVTFWFTTKSVDPDLELLEKLYELNVSDGDRKVNGSYYTPTHIVNYIVEKTINALGSVCDPACGSGAFLIESAKYLHNKFGVSFYEIYKNYLFGVDILPTSVERTKIMLSLLAITHGEDIDFEYNIHVGNSLNFNWDTLSVGQGFDFVVGNPPYVRTKNLRSDVRESVRKWSTASFGNVDLYIPFFELGVGISKTNGRIGYITPSTYLTSYNATLVRDFLTSNLLLNTVVDFNGWQIFEGAITYTCITILDKRKSESIAYTLVDSKEKLNNLNELAFNLIETKSLVGKEWRLLSKIDAGKIFKIENAGSPLFRYVDRFVTGIATLSNDLFLVCDIPNEETYLKKEYGGSTFLIERSITKAIIKPNIVKDKTALRNNMERVIYPYKKNRSGVIEIIPEQELKTSYPMVYKYLCATRQDLELRDKGGKKYEAWYAYGRRQGLDTFGKKIILPMMNNKPSFITVDDEETLIYCGYAIYPKRADDFWLLEKVLNSEIMWFYLKKTSKNYSGGFKSFAKNYVKNFSIPDFSDREKKELHALSTRDAIDAFLLKKYGLS